MKLQIPTSSELETEFREFVSKLPGAKQVTSHTEFDQLFGTIEEPNPLKEEGIRVRSATVSSGQRLFRIVFQFTIERLRNGQLQSFRSDLHQLQRELLQEDRPSEIRYFQYPMQIKDTIDGEQLTFSIEGVMELE